MTANALPLVLRRSQSGLVVAGRCGTYSMPHQLIARLRYTKVIGRNLRVYAAPIKKGSVSMDTRIATLPDMTVRQLVERARTNNSELVWRAATPEERAKYDATMEKVRAWQKTATEKTARYRAKERAARISRSLKSLKADGMHVLIGSGETELRESATAWLEELGFNVTC